MSEKKKSFFKKANKKNAAAENLSAAERAKAADVEEIVSPMRQIVNNFLSRKLAVGALVLLIVMFITMFVGPLFMPKYSDSYTDVTQQNIPPTMSLASVPGELKNDIKMIDGYGSFTVGLSNAGKVYVWGSTKIGTTGVDVADIPDDLPQGNIAMSPPVSTTSLPSTTTARSGAGATRSWASTAPRLRSWPPAARSTPTSPTSPRSWPTTASSSPRSRS